MHSDTIDALLPALIKARQAFRPLEKNATAQVGGGRQYHYADLGGVLAATLPALLEHGLMILQIIEPDTSSLVTRLVHVSGQFVECRFPLAFDQTPQGIGSALTYGRRYSLLTLLGVAAEDDDGQAAQPSARTAKAPPPAPPKAVPKVSKPQVAELWGAARAHGWTNADVAELLTRYQVKATGDLPAEAFEPVLATILRGRDGAGPPEPPPTSTR